VQTASGERSGIITSEEVENLTVMNRDFATLIALLPGVVDNQDIRNLTVPTDAEIQGDFSRSVNSGGVPHHELQLRRAAQRG
jgi:hypothetical protein